MSATLTAAVSRVVVHSEVGRFDVVLPATVAVAELIPDLIDHIATTTSLPQRYSDVPTDWQLTRLHGAALSSRQSLRANGVHDGDAVLLRPALSACAPTRADDVMVAVAAALATGPVWTRSTTRTAATAIALWVTGWVTFGLLVAGRHGAGPWCALVAGLLCVAASVAAVACARSETFAASVPGACATVLAAAAAYLTVPGEEWSPRLMFAGAAGGAAAILATRLRAGRTVFTAVASFDLIVMAVAASHLVLGLRVSASGAVLAAGSVGMIAIAPRLAMWASGLKVPRLPATDQGGPDPQGSDCAEFADATVSGLVCGFSAAAALGAAAATIGGGVRGAVFAAVAGAVLVTRSTTHVAMVQKTALLTSGTACVTVAAGWALLTWPSHGQWIALGGAVAAAATGLLATAPAVSPVGRRFLELTEYLALAALIPLACWVSGVFGAARGLHLS